MLPAEPLAAHVAHFWWVRWSLPEPRSAETLSHPSVHIVFEHAARALIYGVPTRRFSKRLAGDGWAFGIKFRPAAFAPLPGKSLATLTDRRIPLCALFGEQASRLEAQVREAKSLEQRIASAEEFLLRHAAALPPMAARVRDLTERMASDRGLLRVQDAAASLGVDARTLQRHFRALVGVSPKWVIQRYRLHEAAEELKSTPGSSLAELALRLGYYDQAHFTREFKAVVGHAPTQFARRTQAQGGANGSET